MRTLLAATALLAGCSRCPPRQPAEPHTDILCSDLFDEDRVPEYSVRIAEEEWLAIIDEYENWEQRQDDGLNLKPYHPLERFEADGEVIDDAMIRLKGNPCCSWEGDKMQFVISFNKIDDDGRWKGLRKLTLDAPPYDPSNLRERVALSYFEDAGLATSCANHARLNINGAYYGLYTNIEHVDREFLERQYPEVQAEGGTGEFGDLYKWAYTKRRFTLENNGGVEHRPGALNEYRGLDTLADAREVLDWDQAMQYWGAEAMINQSDGYWAGSINYYIYDRPGEGWQFIPWDLDNAINFWRAKKSPWTREDHHRIAPVMDWVLEDETSMAEFREAVAQAHRHHDVDVLIERVDRWYAQIRPHVEEDPHRQFSMAEHDDAVADLRRRLLIRDGFICNELAGRKTRGKDE